VREVQGLAGGRQVHHASGRTHHDVRDLGLKSVQISLDIDSCEIEIASAGRENVRSNRRKHK
jgi:outer membrane murein-binding lipoprotein Lpp